MVLVDAKRLPAQIGSLGAAANLGVGRILPPDRGTLGRAPLTERHSRYTPSPFGLMQRRSVWGVMALLGAVVAFLLPGIVLGAPIAATTQLKLPSEIPALESQPGQSLSANWAGYAAYSQPAGSVSKVSGTWVEPAVTCLKTGSQYAVFWVGIDGYSSSSVEQTGTLAVCNAGVASYYAWWELFPTNAIQVIPKLVVSPGDSISASVTDTNVNSVLGASFTMSITDRTTHKSFSITGSQAPVYAKLPEENSAECIVERPAELTSSGFVLLHLANFGTVTFSSCEATVGGVSAGVGLFAPAAIIYMVHIPFNPDHIIYLASPGGPLDLSTWAFTTTWQGYN